MKHRIVSALVLSTFLAFVVANKPQSNHKRNDNEDSTSASGSASNGHGNTNHASGSSHHGKDNKTIDNRFSDAELERLCPSASLEILKNIPTKNKSGCQSNNHDYWYQNCLCYYGKKSHCPDCPKGNSTNAGNNGHPTLKPFANHSHHDDSAAMSKINIYNSPSGTVNLYFYLTGMPIHANNGSAFKINNGSTIKSTTIRTSSTTEVPVYEDNRDES